MITSFFTSGTNLDTSFVIRDHKYIAQNPHSEASAKVALDSGKVGRKAVIAVSPVLEEA
jgi:hypothetical protein